MKKFKPMTDEEYNKLSKGPCRWAREEEDHRTLVDIQKMDEVSGNASSYSRHVEDESEDGGRGSEDTRANPDLLPESFSGSLASPRMIMGEAVAHLQGRQLEVYTLMLREGKSSYETAEILGITDGAVKQYYLRAVKFISQYCRQAIRGGRV